MRARSLSLSLSLSSPCIAASHPSAVVQQEPQDEALDVHGDDEAEECGPRRPAAHAPLLAPHVAERRELVEPPEQLREPPPAQPRRLVGAHHDGDDEADHHDAGHGRRRPQAPEEVVAEEEEAADDDAAERARVRDLQGERDVPIAEVVVLLQEEQLEAALVLVREERGVAGVGHRGGRGAAVTRQKREEVRWRVCSLLAIQGNRFFKSVFSHGSRIATNIFLRWTRPRARARTHP